jgi:hypothetical protein
MKMNPLRALAVTVTTLVLIPTGAQNLAQAAGHPGASLGAGTARSHSPDESTLELSRLEEEIRRLTARMRSSPETSAATQTELRPLLERHFDTELARRQAELTSLEQRVRQLRQQLDLRQAAREQIVTRQLERLLDEPPHFTEQRLPAAFGPLIDRSNSESKERIVDQLNRARANARAVALSIRIYMKEHNGSLPPSLAMLPGTESLIAEITGQSQLIYLKPSDEMLFNLRQVLAGAHPAPRTPAEVTKMLPVLLIPMPRNTVVATVDGAVWTVPEGVKSHAEILQEYFQLLTSHHPNARIDVKAGASIPFGQVNALLDILKVSGLQLDGFSIHEEETITSIQID